jgi:hypothetical protein
MAWSATILSKTIDSNRSLRVTVRLTENAKVYDFEVVVAPTADADWLKREIRDRIDSLTRLETFATNLPLGPIDPTVIDPTPDPAVVAREDWLRRYWKWKGFMRAVSEGFVAADHPQLVALTNSVKADWLPAYVDYMQR